MKERKRLDMSKVVALGELLIDMIPIHNDKKDQLYFEAKAGGAPANVLSGLSKWGHRTSFIGKVGNDRFGSFLKCNLEKIGIDISGLVSSDFSNTTVTIVSLDDYGERSFSFYSGADRLLNQEEVDYELIKEANLFHFGSISLSQKMMKEVTFSSVKTAKKNNKLVSFDPNLRLDLWDNYQEAREVIREAIKLADIVKLSEEELQFLTGLEDTSKSIKILGKVMDVPFLFVTKGKDGCIYQHYNHIEHIQGYRQKAVDSTGAGDAFVSGILHKFLKLNKNPSELVKEEIKEMVTFANHVAGESTLVRGGFDVVPELNEIYLKP